MAKDRTWKDAIEIVLAQSSAPMHYSDITAEVIRQGLKRILGATPDSSVNAHIASSIKHEGIDSPYIRVDKGVFALRDSYKPPEIKAHVPAAGSNVNEDDEKQYDLISAFGMFWRREAVAWTSSPKLLGMQRIGADPVNFCDQVGIYLLYDGREVIYVGRSADRPLGVRLYEHTKDRLSTRWDRFSWFGLRPVSAEGQLGSMRQQYQGDVMIPALEAILIEAVEPRQNRRRGDDLAAVEYLQHEDPSIKKKQLKESFEIALSKL